MQDIDIVQTMNAALPPFQDKPRVEAFALLYQLPFELSGEEKLDGLLQKILERLLSTIRSASRGALLMKDPRGDDLLLKAHFPLGAPSVSMTLARRAIEERQAFLWLKTEDPSASQLVNEMECGMYAPLIWKDNVLGVVCVDNSESSKQFTTEDLQLLVAVAQYAALAIANTQMQADLRTSAQLLERLLTNFSPKIRLMLVEKARHGKLRLGGEKSEVTILMSDIRGFTRISAAMSSDDVVEMLNDYLPRLSSVIFKYDGTIDKFIGDAILAVFGSPQPDNDQHFKAVYAGLEMQRAVRELNAARAARGLVTCELGIGIHSGEVLHGFSLALVIGILIGTYSSIAIAAPILVAYQDWRIERGKRPVTMPGKSR